MDKEKLLALYPEYTSVLGPYLRPDGRQHVVLNNSNAPKGTKGKTKTISYPKALKEIELQTRIENDETIDHHDRLVDNNDQSNLVVKPRNQHSSEDALRVEIEPVECVGCGHTFIPSREQRSKRSLNKAGPFCSRKCSGAYGTLIRKGEAPLERDPIVVHHYRIDK